MFGLFSKPAKPEPGAALPGRTEAIETAETHYVNGERLKGPFPDGAEHILFGMGCFWGAERMFWTLPGVIVTSVGYAGGETPNPTYREVCSGQTGHTEIVRVTFDPARISARDLLATFWEGHDPTQGMRQGNDVGTQYRSAVYTTTPEQQQAAIETSDAFGRRLREAGYGPITTEVADAPPYYFAEDYHQQYLAKNPGGYCGLGGTGVSCPVGVAEA